MKRKIGFFVALMPLFFVGCANSPSGIDQNIDMSVRQITISQREDAPEMLDKAKSAVVGISVDLDEGYAIGSGVAINGGGYILTNFHVIEEGGRITLYFADQTTGVGQVIWGDPNLDIAVLKSSRAVPYLQTEDIENISVGQDVYAIGTPLTLQFKHTVTKGIISATDRVLETESSYGLNYLQSLIQHDASINPGNSGGPLITSDGKVVGINTLKASEGEGLGFAVPIEIGKVVVEKIEQAGHFEAPYLGVFAIDSALAQIYNQNFNERGVFVVSTSGSAKQAGIKNGDLITKIDDIEIDNMLDFRVELYKKNIGDKIKIELIREGNLREVDAILTKR